VLSRSADAKPVAKTFIVTIRLPGCLRLMPRWCIGHFTTLRTNTGILRRHLLEGAAISTPCDEPGLQPTFKILAPSQILAHAGLRPQFAVKVMTLVK
jgi:hypothetical protein